MVTFSVSAGVFFGGGTVATVPLDANGAAAGSGLLIPMVEMGITTFYEIFCSKSVRILIKKRRH